MSESHSNKEKYVLYLVCFNTYVKQGGGTTGNANEAATYNYGQILDLNLPNTIALFIDKKKADDIEHAGTIRPWQKNVFAEDSIPDTILAEPCRHPKRKKIKPRKLTS